jgi:hypothetical protein
MHSKSHEQNENGNEIRDGKSTRVLLSWQMKKVCLLQCDLKFLEHKRTSSHWATCMTCCCCATFIQIPWSLNSKTLTYLQIAAEHTFIAKLSRLRENSLKSFWSKLIVAQALWVSITRKCQRGPLRHIQGFDKRRVTDECRLQCYCKHRDKKTVLIASTDKRTVLIASTERISLHFPGLPESFLMPIPWRDNHSKKKISRTWKSLGIPTGLGEPGLLVIKKSNWRR